MEKETPLSLNRIFHYTDEPGKLLSILKNGFQPRFSREKFFLYDTILKDLGAASGIFDQKVFEEKLETNLKIKMTCFCDIPLDLIGNHVNQYGSYAIGLKKEWAEKNKICPIFYVPNESASSFLLSIMIKNYTKNINIIEQKGKENFTNSPDSKWIEALLNVATFYNCFVELFAYIKLYKGENPKTNEKDYKFYDEREWRYIPKTSGRFIVNAEDNLLEDDDPDSTINLGFNCEDITDIFVPSEMVGYLKKELSKIDGLKELNTNIIQRMPQRKEASICCRVKNYFWHGKTL